MSDASNFGSPSDSEDTWDMLDMYKLCRTSSFEEMFCCLISFNTVERKGDEKRGEGRKGGVGNSHAGPWRLHGCQRPPPRPASQNIAAGRSEHQTMDAPPRPALPHTRQALPTGTLSHPGILPICAQASLTPACLYARGKGCS